MSHKLVPAGQIFPRHPMVKIQYSAFWPLDGDDNHKNSSIIENIENIETS